MRSHYRAIAFAISLATTTVVLAQTGGPSTNPIRRGGEGEIFYYGPLQEQGRSTFGRGALDNTGIGRPNPRNQHQVTPVPEPSQWALMLAGLALVGYIARRSSRSTRDTE